jgi:aldehyde dehydrogenase (NAD+)
MPFGGVGASGLGRYYGKYGFNSLSHAKSIVISPRDVCIDALLPPYTPDKAIALGEWFAPSEISELTDEKLDLTDRPAIPGR